MRLFLDPAVAAHFETYPANVRSKLLALRELVFAVAAQTQGVGTLQETLRWNEPAYVTSESKSGSTIRMDWKAKRPEQYAIYFNCNTGLVETFRTLFPKDFQFEGNRAIVLQLRDKVPKDALAVCIAASLTYHANKRTNAPVNGQIQSRSREIQTAGTAVSCMPRPTGTRNKAHAA